MLQALSSLTLAFQFASPGPILVEFGPITIRWYGLLIASAVLIGVSLSQDLAKQRNVDPNLIGDLAIWLVIGAIPAARLYYVLFEWQQYAQHPEDIIAIWKGGIAIHGAILGGTLATIIFARIQKISVWLLADLVVPSVILGQAIGRWGNFFNSEAFGDPTNLPWKLYIPQPNRPQLDNCPPLDYCPKFPGIEYFHPTFLYESIWNIMVFVVLMTLFYRDLNRRPHLKVGTLALIYMVAYSTGRVWIEGLRTDSLMVGPLRMAQLVSLSAIALGLIGLIWLYRVNRPLPDVVPAEDQQWDKVTGS